MELYSEVNNCRFCGSTRLDSVLDLGNLCISDFIESGKAEDRAPLELMLCNDCGLVQLHHTVDRDRLYRSYYYKTGTNESMIEAMQSIVDDVATRITWQAYDQVVDIGCNDGTLLSLFQAKEASPYHHCNITVPLVRIGFEPCFDLCIEAMGKDGITHIINSFYPPPAEFNFGSPLKPKVITSIAMFYDLDDPNSFVAAIKDMLHPNGLWVVQFQGLQDMLSKNAFDNICHEHLLYIDDVTFEMLLNKHGLELKVMSSNITNGGSTRYIIGHAGAKPKKWFPNGLVNDYSITKAKEKLKSFAENTSMLRDSTLRLLDILCRTNKLVLGCAASTKANTYLQYIGIGPELLSAIGDRNADKHGKLTVGTHIPIISEEEMLARKPKYLLALAWHFLDSFRQRYKLFERTGGKWIIGLPELNII